jgi:hypothetical protein
MSRPVFILNNRKKVKNVKDETAKTVMFGSNYHLKFEIEQTIPDYSKANLGDILFC